MTNRDNEIKQANRKAMKKSLPIFIIACVGGGVLGFCGAYFGVDQIAGSLKTAGSWFSATLAPWLLVACLIAYIAVCLPLYRSAKKRLAQWDGEDETILNAMDSRLSIAMWASSIFMICGMFLIATVYASSKSLLDNAPLFFLLLTLVFLALLLVNAISQQKLVDLTKSLYPEKEGSVYDLHFQKKWVDSCDEAEKIMIGQCAYKAYAAVNGTCIALWTLFTLGALFLDTGILPVLTVCIIWAVSQSVYCWWSIKLSQPGSKVL